MLVLALVLLAVLLRRFLPTRTRPRLAVRGGAAPCTLTSAVADAPAALVAVFRRAGFGVLVVDGAVRCLVGCGARGASSVLLPSDHHRVPLRSCASARASVHALGVLGIVVLVRDVGPRQVVGDDVTDAAYVLRQLRERAHHEDQQPAPVVHLERGDHRPSAVELIDPRCA